ncbi:MAG: hypothetical protein R3A47_06440 [Polyangiales bacterium]
MILDFVGNAGRHKLVTPLDVLAGKELPEDIKKIAAEFVDQDKPTHLQILEAEKEAVRREKEAEERRKRANRVQFEVRYAARDVNLFGDAFVFYGVKPFANDTPASSKQLRYMRGLKIPFDECNPPGRRTSSRFIDSAKGRRSRGLCTYRQARVVVGLGFVSQTPASVAGENYRNPQSARVGPSKARRRFARDFLNTCTLLRPPNERVRPTAR